MADSSQLNGPNLYESLLDPLVLSLPTELEQRNLLTDIVYGVILVTLLGQGLTLRVLLPRWKDKLACAEEKKSVPTQA
jgi:NhaP-type Na+/H+ or K+/H+ antiporter